MNDFSLVINGNITLTQISDPNTVNLVYATFAIAIITAIGMGITSWLTRTSLNETKKSNELLRLEFENKIRPDLQVVNFSPEPLEENTKTVKFRPNIINYGNISAHSIRIYYATYQETCFLIPDFVRDEHEIKAVLFMPYDGSLLPTKPLHILSPIEYQLDGIERRIVVWIEYEFLENNREDVIFSIRVRNEKYLDHIFYSNSDIVKAREKWRKFKSGDANALK